MATLTSPTRWAAPPKRYRVGEIVKHTGLSRQTLHNYTAMGLIHAAEHTGGGHRLYDESVFERLSLIARLKRTRTMEQIADLLAMHDRPAPPAAD
ncbi:MerR family transcriptional regulator [Planctomycetales bacterium ZRK34]|nr:MerR family transcriptional regulator [Planctomycetales bacterium ZRK34]